MRYEEFLAEVRVRAGLADTAEVEAAIRATLTTLGERIPAGMAENLAAQLPFQAGEHLRRTGPRGGTGADQRPDRDGFIPAVAERAGMDRARATVAARAVLEVTDETSKARVIERLCDILPDDLAGPGNGAGVGGHRGG